MFPVSNTLPLLDLSLDSSEKSLFGSCYEACLKGDFKRMMLLLKNDFSLLSQYDNEGQTLLYACVASNELEILRWLHKENPLALKQVRNDGKNLMHIAAIKGHFEVVKWLHGKEPSLIDQVDKNQSTPLHEAAFHEHIPICKLFIEAIKVNGPLILQIAQKKCPKTLAFLLESGVKPDTSNAFDQTLLHLAAEAGQNQNVRCLVQHGASINAQDQSKRTPLFLALIQNRLWTMQLLLQKKADPSLVNEANETVLHAAAVHNHQQLLKELLIYPVCKNLVNAKDQDGQTPLHKAVCGDPKPEIVKLLLANGADVNIENNYDCTPLYWATKHGHIQSAELLLDHETKLDSVNANKDLPFNLTVCHEQNNFPQHFLRSSEKSGKERLFDDYNKEKAKAQQVTNKKSKDKSPIVLGLRLLKGNIEEFSPDLSKKSLFASCYEACHKGDFQQIQSFLNSDSTLLFQCDDKGQTLLYACAASNELKILEWFIEQDSLDLKQVRNDGKTLMHIAAIKGHFELVKWLNDKNPSLIDQVDKNHFTPLHEAVFYEHIPICKLFIEKLKANRPLILQIAQKNCSKTLAFLLESGVKPDTSNSSKQTLLHLAAEAGQNQNVRCLLQHGAFINAQDQSKRTPLFLALIQNRLWTVQFLLKNKADLSLVDEANETVLHAAAIHNNQQLLKELLTHPVCKNLVNAKDQDGKTPLHKAVWGSPKQDVVAILIKNGADVNAENNYDYTPLHWAAKHGHTASARLLLNHGAMLNKVNANNDLPFDLAIRHEQDDFLRHFLESSEQSVREPIPKDIEGHYYKKLLKVKEKGQIEEQILNLQILSYHYVEKKDFITASKILNAALALISKLPEKPYLKVVEQSIIYRIELIEAIFLQSKGINQELKTSFTDSHRALLKAIRKVDSKADIQITLKYLTTRFKDMLEMMIAEIQKVMGEPPVNWACMGMGSMSRDEMCPYSDVEFAFLLEEETEEAMHYFRTLSQILELRIINLGETKFPIFGDHYPSPTPDGFCMDSGGNTPLGVTGVYELIGTPETLAKFQDVEWMDRSIILPNAMSHVCFVAGTERLVDDYNKEKEKAQEWIDSKSKDKNCIVLSLRLLKGHIEEFSPNLTREKEEISAFGIKKELYRPFQEIIGSLSLFYQLKAKTTFTRIDELVKLGVFSKKGGKNLKKAINRILELRLDAHLFYQDEQEYLCHPEEGKPLDPHLMYFNAYTLQILKEIYRILIPFHRSAEEFLKTKNKKAFRNSDFYDEHSKNQGIQFVEDFQYAKAQEAHQQAVALNPNDVQALLHLGSIENQMGKSQDALQRSLKALEIAKAKYGEIHFDVAASYKSIGAVYYKLGDYEKALEYFQQALKIWRKVREDNHPEVDNSYNHIGLFYKDPVDSGKALKYHQKALEIQLEILGGNHPNVATSYAHIGSFYNQHTDYEKALEYHQKALKIRLEAFGDNHPSVATSYDDISNDFNGLFDFEKALEYQKQALKIRRQVFGDNHQLIAQTSYNIGCIYDSHRDYEKALEFYGKTLKIWRHINGDNDLGVALCYKSIGLVYYRLGNYEKALEFYGKTLKIQRQVLEDNHPDVAQSYKNIDMVNQKLGSDKKST